ncbi:hypothetical protein [Empedobacter brevis]|uniref:hypothetical protein n=1 Tax=Empedobacter brevis TaxID=247 RepID=UPI0039B04CB5
MKIFNKILLINLIFVSSSLFAQVGINTNTPRASLDVQGDLEIRNKIYLGGDDTTIGKLGEVGSVLVSQGDNKPPTWKVLRRPEFKPETYYLINYESSSTEDGITLTNNYSANRALYTKDMSISSFLAGNGAGAEIKKLEKTFKINNSVNKVALVFETVTQINSNSIYHGVDFACGVFVDDKLKGVRTFTLNQTTASRAPFYTFTLLASENNLPKKVYTAKVACKRRASINSYSGTFGIGKDVFTNINSFMTQSTLKIEVLEIPDPNNTEPVYN